MPGMNLYAQVDTAPQTVDRPIRGREEDMEKNAAGGFVFKLDLWSHYKRVLILGTEGGTYYVGQKTLTESAVRTIREALSEDPLKAISMAAEISDSGRAPKNDPAVFVLVLAYGTGDIHVKRIASEHFNKIVRTGTHLFQFVNALKQYRKSFGRSVRNSIGNWYHSRGSGLARQLVKYRSREGWSHQDVARMTHFAPKNDEERVCFAFAAKKNLPGLPVPKYLRNYFSLRHARSPETVCEIIAGKGVYDWEMIPNQHLNKDVWAALLPGMPYGALVRNLGNMTSHGVFDDIENIATVVERLGDKEAIQKSRQHPIVLLDSALRYNSGTGDRGKKVWTPVAEIREALEDAHEYAYGTLPPLEQNVLVGLDVSSSMDSYNCSGFNLMTARTAACSVALILKRQCGVRCRTMAFADGFREFVIGGKSRLSDVVRAASGLDFGGTDCALPIRYAIEQKQQVDLFVILTDNETWVPNEHPSELIKQYRREFNPNAKMLVLAFTASYHTIADPRDPGMLDIVGMDAAVPSIMDAFARGELAD